MKLFITLCVTRRVGFTEFVKFRLPESLPSDGKLIKSTLLLRV